MDWNNKNDRGSFLEAFNALCELYRRSFSEGLIKLYFQKLSVFSIEQVVSAIESHIMEADHGSFFPKPAELNALLVGRVEDIAKVQAVSVLEAIRRVGGYGSVTFDDPVSQAVIVRHFGGWERMCRDLTEKDEKWMQKDFAEAYASFYRQGLCHYGHLSGRSERENSAAYLENHENIFFIGDTEKAKKIFLLGDGNVGSFKVASLPAPEKKKPESMGVVLSLADLSAGHERTRAVRRAEIMNAEDVGHYHKKERALEMQKNLAASFSMEAAI